MADSQTLDIKKIILESSNLIKNSATLTPQISKAIQMITNCFVKGKKVIVFGNGGSAADAQHIAAELVGRFKEERQSLPALALNTDTSIITSLSNDYHYNIIFSRQCESMVHAGDVVIGISTSGNSPNIIKGLLVAKKKKALTIALLGNKGGKIKKLVDIPIIVRSSSTPRIQEVHRVIYHIICELVEKNMIKKWNSK